jgi:hypothetical protein
MMFLCILDDILTTMDPDLVYKAGKERLLVRFEKRVQEFRESMLGDFPYPYQWILDWELNAAYHVMNEINAIPSRYKFHINDYSEMGFIDTGIHHPPNPVDESYVRYLSKKDVYEETQRLTQEQYMKDEKRQRLERCIRSKYALYEIRLAFEDAVSNYVDGCVWTGSFDHVEVSRSFFMKRLTEMIESYNTGTEWKYVVTSVEYHWIDIHLVPM